MAPFNVSPVYNQSYSVCVPPVLHLLSKIRPAVSFLRFRILGAAGARGVQSFSACMAVFVLRQLIVIAALAVRIHWPLLSIGFRVESVSACMAVFVLRQLIPDRVGREYWAVAFSPLLQNVWMCGCVCVCLSPVLHVLSNIIP